MTVIAHLSDLHFGRERPDLAAALVETVNRLAPDLVAISGDFTQRARGRQFRAARAFLDRLRAPWIATPGNHDVPLDRPATRLFAPYAAYRRHIARDLAPRWRGGGVVVVALNTVNPLDWQRGRLGRGRLARLRAAFAAEEGEALRVVMAHHPIVHARGERKALLRGAAAARSAFGAAGVDLALSGHLHSWRAQTAEAGGRAVVMVQAGTGVSTRLRDGENDFNLLRLTPGAIRVERYAAGVDETAFRPAGASRFVRAPGGWRADPGTHALGSGAPLEPV